MVREDFCGMCAAIPVALMGAGVGASGLRMSGEQYKAKRKWMLIFGVISLLVSVAIVWWNMDCERCRI